MKRIMLLLTEVFLSTAVIAQNLALDGQDAYGALFRQSVKSCDEFMCRFNGEEYFPELNMEDPQIDLKNLMLLFDYQLAESKGKDKFLTEITAFHSAIQTGNVKLKYDSRNWYAELRTLFVYKKNPVELGIVFQTEKTPKGLSCWTIVGVNGLEKIGYRDSTSRMVVSPEQHEADFMEIDGDFKYSAKCLSQFRSYKTKMNALSYFFALVETGTLIFDSRVQTVFHFYDVPSYVFSIKYHDRKKSNTGWLIYDYMNIDTKGKASKLNKLLGK